jgi:hypothetical protein
LLSKGRFSSGDDAFMTDRRSKVLILGMGLLALSLSGCASGSSFSAWRPGTGVWSNTPPAINGGRTWNGPLVQPGIGLQPTPAMSSPPAIVPGPGPMLPDASGRKYAPLPGAAGIRYPWPQRPMLPPVVPYHSAPVPQRGAPIAQQPMPSSQRPAELSGEIEIIPGPTLRAQRARMEMLPPPPEGEAATTARETSHSTGEGDGPAVPAQPAAE